MSTNSVSDPQRPNKVPRNEPPPSETSPAVGRPTPRCVSLVSVVFGMRGSRLKPKWGAWVTVYCSSISFANSRSSGDARQMTSSFMLSPSATVMSVLRTLSP
ncbi:PAT complex subunit Asterix-like [Dasypus novemcinctus]|uniref:PAT complex subunit Asterix-like n=1 Tax=Dasypus novemcinctus TaxID=9361 RepID=UPI00265D9BEB|nr:PAT complex subunit Asterix-like [Dasypus novemcinctus]